MQNPSFVLKKKLEVAIEDRPIPEINDPHSVKIQVKKTGICGSDVHFYTHGQIGDAVVSKPMVLGHESSGVIVEVGEKVTSLKVGDRVAMEPGVPSRFSKEYKSGNYHLCPDMTFAACPNPNGIIKDGTLTKYYILPEDFCVKLPDNVSLEEGALVEPLSVAVHAVKRMGVSPCSSVVVFGAGPIGLVSIGVLQAYGATTIVAVDLVESRLELAKKLGATHTYISEKGDTPEQTAAKIKKMIGFAPEYVLDASGAEYSITCGVEILTKGGLFMQVANGQKDKIEFAITRLVSKEITFTGSFRYNYGDYVRAVELIESHKINVKSLITHTLPFDQAEEAYKLVRSGKAIKVIIDGPE